MIRPFVPGNHLPWSQIGEPSYPETGPSKKLLCRAGANEDIHVRLGIVFRKETKGRKTNTAANKKNLMVAPVKTASQRTHDTDRIPFLSWSSSCVASPTIR